jgi:hypothetical protein
MKIKEERKSGKQGVRKIKGGKKIKEWRKIKE